MKDSLPFTKEQMDILIKIKEILSYTFRFFKNTPEESLDVLGDLFMILEKNSKHPMIMDKALEDYLIQNKLAQSQDKTAVFAKSIKTSIEQSIDKDEPYDMEITLLLLGGSATGKTSIINQFCKNRFPNEHRPVLGIDAAIKKIIVDHRNIQLMLWDISSAKMRIEFKNRDIISTYEGELLSSEIHIDSQKKYLRFSQLFFGVFDLTDKKSLAKLQQWIDIFTQTERPLTLHKDGTMTLDENRTGVKIPRHNKKIAACNQLSQYPIMILGNKSDLKNQRAISQEEIDTFITRNNAQYPGIRYYEISAKDKTNLEKPFIDLLSYILLKVFPEKSADITMDIAEDERCSSNHSHSSNYSSPFSYTKEENKKKTLLTKTLKQIARLIDPEKPTTTLQNAKALAFYRLYRNLLESPVNNLLNTINSWKNYSSGYKDSNGKELCNQKLLEKHQNFWDSGETDSIDALNDIYSSVFSP